MATNRRSKVASYVLLTGLALIVGFPLYLVFASSLMNIHEITSKPPTLFSTHPNFSTYKAAFVDGNLGQYLMVSGVQTALIVIGQLITSVLAAFAFAYIEFPLKRTFFVIVLATSMIPFEVTVTANLQTMGSFGWLETMQGLVVPFLATGFGVFLMRQAFMQIPKEMHEAAVLDGLGSLQFLRRVALPLTRPTIAALTVFTFLGAWNQYLWPLLSTGTNTSLRTIQIGLKGLGGTVGSVNVTLAGAAIAVLPLLVLLIFFQKHLVRSLTAGAVK